MESQFVIIEKTGHKEETQELFDALNPYGLIGFVRSGRIAIPKPMESLKDYISDLESAVTQN